MTKDNDFPWITTEKIKLNQELSRLKDKLQLINPKEFETNGKLIISFSHLGYPCINNFFQYERMKTKSHGRISCYDFWKLKKDKIIDYFTKHNYATHLQQTVAFLGHPPSYFPMNVAAIVYKQFQARNIFDPFAGWGNRCLAAMCLGLNYTGVDSNVNLYKPYQQLINFIKPKSNVNMVFDKVENIDIKQIKFDFVLTSPPFWKDNLLLEEYNNTENDYNQFLHNALIPTVIQCLQKKVWVCLHLPDNMYNDLKKSIGKCKRIIYFKTRQNTQNTEHGTFRLEHIYCFKY